jgi:putative ABC transport system permease protein
MRKATLIKVAAQSILRNKLRTFLTMLGIVIGVAAVIVMVAVGYGAQRNIEQQINNLGTNMIMVMPGTTRQAGVNMGSGSFNRLTLADAEKLEREGTLLSAVSPVVSTYGQVIGGNGNWRTRLDGVASE